jgi:hypothetical protein
VHRAYPDRGGLDLLIGGGALRYQRESIRESYYSARLALRLLATLDPQHLSSPAYNRDRGQVWVETPRLHIETGKK